MSKRDIEKVRAASKAPNGPGWAKWYDQFAIKSVVKRAYKLLPSSSDRLDRVIEHDNEAMEFDFNQRGTDTAALTGQATKKLEAPSGRPSRLSAIVGAAGLSPDTVPAGEPAVVQQEAAE